MATAIKVSGAKNVIGYVLCHQPKSFEWQVTRAKPHSWKQVPHAACGASVILNEIIDL